MQSQNHHTPNVSTPSILSFVSMNHYMFFLLISTLACCDNPSKAVQYFGKINAENSSQMVIVEPDAYPSFSKLVQRAQHIICQDSIPTIKLLNKKSIKYVGLDQICMAGVSCIYRDRRETLEIRDNQIITNIILPTDSLPQVMKLHYFNFGKREYFSTQPSKARISISFLDYQPDQLKIILASILSTYSSLGEMPQLSVSLERRITPPPPPPLKRNKGTIKKNTKTSNV